MRRIICNIEPFDWMVELCIAVNKFNGEYILRRLFELGAGKTVMKRATKLLSDWSLDNGLTYSNKRAKETIIVVGSTSSPSEFQNSLQHEIRHLCNDITIALKLDWKSEKVAYLVGDINALVFPFINDLLCCECHKDLKQ